MREIKTIETNEKYSVEVNEVIKIKPYYTLTEKCAIYSDMKSKETAFDREFSLIVLTAKFCTNIDTTDMTDDDIYDLVAELRLIEEFKMEVDEYLDIPKLIDRDENVYNALMVLSNAIDEKLDMSKFENGFADLQKVLTDGSI